MSRHRLSNGFTIIELIAVIVVLGIALAPLGVMFTQVMTKYAQPEAIQVATALARQEMERVTGLRYSSIVSEASTTFTDFPNYNYQVIVGTISGESDTDEYKQVEVLVTNSSIGISVSLKTIVTIKQDVS
jgi:prepilin-type N-terminal cleavage/methylation domain-containing protein